MASIYTDCCWVDSQLDAEFEIETDDTLVRFWGDSESRDTFMVNDLLTLPADEEGQGRPFMCPREEILTVPSIFLHTVESANYLKKLENSLNITKCKKAKEGWEIDGKEGVVRHIQEYKNRVNTRVVLLCNIALHYLSDLTVRRDPSSSLVLTQNPQVAVLGHQGRRESGETDSLHSLHFLYLSAFE